MGVYYPVNFRSQDVYIQDYTGELVNLYMYRPDAITTLSANVSKGDDVINVSSTTGMAANESINLLGGGRHSQFIIKSIGAGTVNIVPKSDADYSLTNTIVEAGPVNMNVSGTLASPEKFCIHAPDGVKFDLVSLVISIQDNSPMDSALFGGLTRLPNGFVLRGENGISKNFGTVYNNIGFAQQKFTTKYDDKAPSGFYGFIAKIESNTEFGAVVRLDGSAGDEFCALINDNLTGLTELTVTVGGHVVTEY